MGYGKGENSETPPETHAVNINSGADDIAGEYQPVQGHHHERDREQAADMDLALVMFRSLSILAAVSAVLCFIVNIVSLSRSFNWHLDYFIAALRIYACILAVFIAVAETEWEWLFRQWPYLEYWFGRGMLQIFVAVMTKALSGASWETRFERILHDVAAYMLLGSGIIYAVFGLLCFRKLKRRRIQKHQWRENAVRDLEELEKKRRDLQGLLAAGQ